MFINSDRLEKSEKLLVVAVSAIGDFVFLLPYFKALSKRYPKLKIDLFLDETGGRKISRINWPKRPPKKASVLDWVSSCSFFNKIYRVTDSKKSLNIAMSEAKLEKYQTIFVLSWGRQYRHFMYSRKISSDALVVGIETKKKPRFNVLVDRTLKKLPIVVKEAKCWFVTDLFSCWFEETFGLKLSEEEKLPFINIPEEWQIYARNKFMEWGIETLNSNAPRLKSRGLKHKDFAYSSPGFKTMGYSRRFNKEEADLKNRSNKNGVVFFNAYSNNRSRNWPIENVPEFIKKLRKMSSFADSVFIVNIPPGTKRKDFVFMEKELSSRIFIFSADENFFQLPAILSLCDLVISTETSVMHLSRMLNVPLVVLMRDNCLEWKPYKLSDENIIFALNHSWIKDIPVNLVVDKIEKLYGV